MRGLLEREDRLAALRSAWDETVRSRRSAVVLVRGEAGSGKTALVEAFADGVAGPVLTGACHPLSTPRPLAPFADLAERLGGELADLLAGDPRPHEVAEALARSASAQGPAVVLLEDLHWADDASLDVLRLLGRALRDRALLVVATYRDDEAGDALLAALGDLSSVHRIDVPPLSPAAVKALCRGTRRDAAALHAVTGGNAFHVTELLASPDEALPASVVEATRARLHRLSPGARAVAEAVAVVPQAAELWLVEALTDPSGVDEAVASGVLVCKGNEVAFRHEIARRSVETGLPPYQRRSLHRRALAALLTHGAEPARLAHHAEQAGDAAAVVEHAPAAGARASRLGSKKEAAAHYDQALRHLPPGQDDLRRADLLEALSHALYVLDGMGRAVTVLEEALAVRRAHGDLLGEGRVLVDLAARLGCAAREAEAPSVVLAAQRVLEQLPPSTELGRVYAGLAYAAMEHGDTETMFEWGRKAIEIADATGDPAVAVRALNTMGSGELFAGRDPALLLQCIELATRAGLDEALGTAYINLAQGYAEQRRTDQVALLEEGLRQCVERGLELWRRYLVVHLAELHLHLGLWDQVMDELAEPLGSPHQAALMRLHALTVAARVRARRGDPGAQELLDEAWQLAEGHEIVDWQRPIRVAAAELAWTLGTGDVVAVTEDAVALAREADCPWAVDDLVRWRRLAGVEGEPASGRTLLSQPSVAGWRELGCGFEVAMALLEEGEGVQALELLQLIGAHGTAARVAAVLREQGLRELPRGPRGTTRTNPAQLTDREVEVLRLLAAGLSNAAIAEQLVLSTKTVDKHVSATLRKLGVPSRREAAQRAEALGLEPLVLR